jgi:hypothetical protein
MKRMRRLLYVTPVLLLALAAVLMHVTSVVHASGGLWSSTTNSLHIARWGQTATLLPNGTVLVAGGFDSHEVAVASAELYDPSTGRWSDTGSMRDARWDHTAILLASGTVLAAGGISDFSGPTPIGLASAELYTPPDAASQITTVMNLVDSFSLATGTQTSLDAKLEAAQAAVGAGHTTAACGQLTAFINEVTAQAGKGLSTSQASELLDEARRLELVLDC